MEVPMRRAFLVLLLLLASACAMRELRPGMSEAEVRQAMGPPAMELRDADGSRHLAYPSGPFGLHTYMARIAPDGRLQAVEQVLDDGRFEAIRPGMTSDELLRHIGPPGERMRFDNLRQTAWDYRFRDTWGYIAILSVMVDDSGRVASRITQRLDRDRRLF
jgi:outer membrane protein assembly factor BamE (lipoprotein component of BamABCDE complex)